MFNCNDVSEKVSRSMDQPLPLGERMMIAIHLGMCKYCRRFRDQLQILRKAIRLQEPTGGDTDPLPVLPAEARERIISRLKAYS